MSEFLWSLGVLLIAFGAGKLVLALIHRRRSETDE